VRLTPFKFIVQSVLLEQDSEGKPIGERVSEAVVVYGIEGLEMFTDNLKARLDEGGAIRQQPEVVIVQGEE
jgi:hypothetical protein